MVTSWTCKFWLEFWVCARGIPYPVENADIPAGIGVCPTSERNPFHHCPWDRKEKWEIEALLRNGWKGCWEWECLNSSDVSQFLDLILGITPGIPAWYPQHILGMPFPPFPVFSIRPGPFAMPGTPLKVIRKQIFPGKTDWEFESSSRPFLWTLIVPFAGKSEVQFHLLCLDASNEKSPTFFGALTPKIPPWMCLGPCAGILFPGFPCFRGDPWSREWQALLKH